jgi:biotin synthesis protein BioG
MNMHWHKQPDSKHCLVFFNGWGMDSSICRQCPPPPDWDLLVCYDYISLSVDAAAFEELHDHYDEVVLVAWSMGVWAAGQIFNDGSDLFSHSVAINGTFRPIDANYGIPPEAYQSTVDNFSDETRETFYHRMCHTPERLNHFLAAPPTRDVDSQLDELEAIQAAGPSSGILFNEVIIGKLDRIMPARNQNAFWKSQGIPSRILQMPHYPFFDLTWEELLGDAANR